MGRGIFDPTELIFVNGYKSEDGLLDFAIAQRDQTYTQLRGPHRSRDPERFRPHLKPIDIGMFALGQKTTIRSEFVEDLPIDRDCLAFTKKPIRKAGHPWCHRRVTRLTRTRRIAAFGCGRGKGPVTDAKGAPECGGPSIESVRQRVVTFASSSSNRPDCFDNSRRGRCSRRTRGNL